MAAATLASSSNGQNIVKVFKFTALADTNTFAYKGPAPKAFWCATTSASSSASVQASWASDVFTFKVSSGTPDAALFVLL